MYIWNIESKPTTISFLMIVIFFYGGLYTIEEKKYKEKFTDSFKRKHNKA